jgi:Flp pilus assembly protein CpaB
MATGRRRGRAFIYIALILILLLVLVFAVTRLGGGGIPGLTQTEKQPVAAAPAATPTVQVDTVEIVVTTQNVRRGEELTEGLVQIVSIPREDYTDGVFFNTVDDVLGLRAKFDLEAHTPLTNALVVPKTGAGSLPSFEIPKGMVAISIPISKLSSISYGLQKGDHVNIIASLMMVDLDTNWQSELPNRTGLIIGPGPAADQTNVTSLMTGPPEYTATGGGSQNYLGRVEIDPTINNPIYLLPSEKQRPRLVSQTLIQDVVVLQIGYFNQEAAPVAAESPDAAAQPTPTTTGRRAVQPTPAPVASNPEVATLIVSPQDAVTLNYLMLANASLNLVLRSAGDDQKINTEAVTLQFVLDQYRIPIPAKLPYGINPRSDSIPQKVNPFADPSNAATATPVP